MNNNCNILYLDDEQEILNVFKINLGQEFKVHVSNNFADAVQVLLDYEIKVVLTDQRMPDITGVDFVKFIQDEFPEIVCIIISGYADKDILFQSINEIDIFRYIEKPMQFDEIKHTIEKAIEKYEAIKYKQRLEDELKYALIKAKESDRLKAEFLRSLSHEIRTPVNGIVGFTSLIKGNKHKNISLEYLEIISNSALKLVDIVDDMITASKINAKEFEVKQHQVYLNDLLDDLHKEFRQQIQHKENIKLIVKKRTGETKIPITTDKEKLYNIFVHLLRNAIKFSKNGSIEFGIHDEQNMILYVKDSGIGIPETDKPVIFDFFTQGKQKAMTAEIDGIGIGLSIVKGLVDLLNGEIWFESKKGKGTTFYFKFRPEN